MGQKVHPIGLRLGINKDWKSKWFDKKSYTKNLQEDFMIRRYIHTRAKDAMVAEVEIKRLPHKLLITVRCAQPRRIIGRKGEEINRIYEELARLIDKKKDVELKINVEEVRIPELNAHLVSRDIARQIEQRVSHRRAMKRAVVSAIRFGAKGIKIACAGRLGGAEIARCEWYRERSVPLQTISADISYAQATAFTIYGTVSVKVWIYKGMAEG
ncbi:MAG TPA: 30S ribosomal protein S3 [bacterium (Candidatus Stahlbacteria)]|nr:30S ribosomal protein S3 [Candidatus Stahlbacteria bacterium]